LRIAQQDVLIAKRQEALEEAKRALEEEQKLEEDGVANSLATEFLIRFADLIAILARLQVRW